VHHAATRMIELVQADITTLDVDAIVNAANSTLAGGGGVDGAIHRAAGPELAAAATRLAPCPPGHAVLTPGFRLRARFVIHAVGPIWYGGTEGEPEVLRATYESAFRVAREEPSIRSIAFPAISTGAYMFPKELAAEIALDVMHRNAGDFDRIVACVFDAESLALYERLLSVARRAAVPRGAS
jgi:O-acetyl-ADP-ribose deacetylase (regulator of RNase III)